MSWSSIRKPIISAFLVCYIFCIGIWLLPPSAVRNKFLEPVAPLISYLGLWQSYAVFAYPRKTNLDLQAVVFYKDGSTSTWQYPRVDQLGLFERSLKERYRKFGYEHLNVDKDAVLRPSFCRFVARLNNIGGRTPQTIILVRHWAPIPLPENSIGLPLPTHDRQTNFFSYQVQPGDLE